MLVSASRWMSSRAEISSIAVMSSPVPALLSLASRTKLLWCLWAHVSLAAALLSML